MTKRTYFTSKDAEVFESIAENNRGKDNATIAVDPSDKRTLNRLHERGLVCKAKEGRKTVYWFDFDYAMEKVGQEFIEEILNWRRLTYNALGVPDKKSRAFSVKIMRRNGDPRCRIRNHVFTPDDTSDFNGLDEIVVVYNERLHHIIGVYASRDQLQDRHGTPKPDATPIRGKVREWRTQGGELKPWSTYWTY